MKNIAPLIFIWFSLLSFIFSYPVGRNSIAGPYWDQFESNIYQNATMSINSLIRTNSHQLANTASHNYADISNFTSKKFETGFKEMKKLKKLERTMHCNCLIIESVTNNSRTYSNNFCSQPFTFFLKGFKILVYPIIVRRNTLKNNSEVRLTPFRTTPLFDSRYVQQYDISLKNESEDNITQLVEKSVNNQSENIVTNYSLAVSFSTNSWTECDGGNQRKTAQGGLQTSSTEKEFSLRRFVFLTTLSFRYSPSLILIYCCLI